MGRSKKESRSKNFLLKGSKRSISRQQFTPPIEDKVGEAKHSIVTPVSPTVSLATKKPMKFKTARRAVSKKKVMTKVKMKSYSFSTNQSSVRNLFKQGSEEKYKEETSSTDKMKDECNVAKPVSSTLNKVSIEDWRSKAVLDY